MLQSLLSSPKIAVAEQALNASALRQKVISNNIANVNTPGFKKSEVIFEDLLAQELGNWDGNKLPLAVTNEHHFPIASRGVTAPVVNTIANTTMRTDGNNVDVDVEMAELAKNSIYYNAVAQDLGRYISSLKSVISGGR